LGNTRLCYSRWRCFPIIGEGDEEPNDTFREQLVANAKAAIDAVDALGYIDRNGLLWAAILTGLL
jgi:hypothetical protein